MFCATCGVLMSGCAFSFLECLYLVVFSHFAVLFKTLVFCLFACVFFNCTHYNGAALLQNGDVCPGVFDVKDIS